MYIVFYFNVGYTSAHHDPNHVPGKPLSLSSNLDPESVYKPPSVLQYPDGDIPQERPDSPQSSSSSHSDLSSPSFNRDSDIDFANRTKSEMESVVKKVIQLLLLLNITYNICILGPRRMWQCRK